MKPIKFPGHNTVYAKDQPEYLPLPVHLDTEHGIVTSCYLLNFRERLKILFSGRVYFRTMTFNKPLQPQLAMVENPIKEYNKAKQ